MVSRARRPGGVLTRSCPGLLLFWKETSPGAEDAQIQETGTSADTHGESQLLELFGAEGAAPLVAQAALALRLKRQLAETVEDVSLVLGQGQDERVKYEDVLALHQLQCTFSSVSKLLANVKNGRKMTNFFFAKENIT